MNAFAALVYCRFAAARGWRALLAGLLTLLLVAAAFAADAFLPPDEAFRADVRASGARSLALTVRVAPGYYLYDERFEFRATGATLGAVRTPPGEELFDTTFQKTLATHRGVVGVELPVEQAAGDFRLAVTYQGCSDQGLCYPPQQLRADVSLDGAGGAIKAVHVLPGRELPLAGEVDSTLAGAEPQGVERALGSGSLALVVAAFFGAGLLLSLTPCVLPMLPILSSIIAGGARPLSRARGLSLAASYAMGMALVYTALGVAAGLAGEGLAAALQNAWVLGAFAALLVALALSMFGAYAFALPGRIAQTVATASARLPGGRHAGVFAMGGLSALIVSPCVAAPLAGALLYLGQTRDVALGGAALFALAWGMSVPLLLVGASAGALLPRAGRWMEGVKRFFGLVLLAMAVWTLQPVLPAALALALWGALGLGAAALVFRAMVAAPVRRRWLSASGGAALGVAGALQLVGAATGASDPLRPLAGLSARASALDFRIVRTTAELDAAIAAAGRPVMLDFYADWCVSCKEMERTTFSDPAVRARLAHALLLKIDVTANNPADRELLKRFQLFGPPATIFFDARGREIAGLRVIGYQDSDRFRQTLAGAAL